MAMMITASTKATLTSASFCELPVSLESYYVTEIYGSSGIVVGILSIGGIV